MGSRFAEKNSIPHVRVQHHHAHAVALMSEHNLPFDQPILCCVFDGTGYGTDKTIWGGEWLLVNAVDSIRYAHLKTFPLPGGDACILHPARAALALLFRYGMPGTNRCHVFERSPGATEFASQAIEAKCTR